MMATRVMTVRDAVVLRAWGDKGFGVDGAQAWAAQGFDPASARAWADNDFEPDEARAWMNVGITGPVEARHWSEVGESPVEAALATSEHRRYAMRRAARMEADGTLS
ncbi:MAG: hypothetical protein ACYDH5_00225 [Acidimicrobiales bacterium]